ncbi:MAG: dienelactone hydrolase family protein [Aeromicrobium sp.]
MTSETIQIPVPDGRAEAYVSRPDDQDHPGVLFHVDAIGLRPRIKEMADRIASWGYVVLVPHAFYREGSAEELAPTTDLTEPGAREEFFGGLRTLLSGHTSDRSDADLDAYVTALQGLPGVSGEKIGFTGYCIGGRMAVRAAGLRPDVIAAAGAFHAAGLVTGEDDDSPHRLATRARGEILAGHADHDQSNPAEAIAAFEHALTGAGVTYASAVYPDAPHGFTMSDTSSYDEQATERHFAELEALFARTLQPS